MLEALVRLETWAACNKMTIKCGGLHVQMTISVLNGEYKVACFAAILFHSSLVYLNEF